jgi:hypothetical protein
VLSVVSAIKYPRTGLARYLHAAGHTVRHLHLVPRMLTLVQTAEGADTAMELIKCCNQPSIDVGGISWRVMSRGSTLRWITIICGSHAELMRRLSRSRQ